MRETEGDRKVTTREACTKSLVKTPRIYTFTTQRPSSSPFTSTKGQVTGPKWDPQKIAKRADRCVGFVEVMAAARFHNLKVQFTGLER